MKYKLLTLFIISIVFDFYFSETAPLTSKTVLKNGLTVITSENNFSDVVSAVAVVRAGLIYEDEENNGITQIIQNLLPLGTKTRTFQQIQKELDEYGAKIETNVEFDHSSISLISSKKLFPRAFDIFLDMIFNPIFLETDIQKEKEHFIKNIKNKKEDVLQDAFWLLMSEIYKKDFLKYGKYPDVEIIKKIDREKILFYYKTHYNPKNLVIAISGNFNKLDAISKIKFYEKIEGGEKISIDKDFPILSSKDIIIEKEIEVPVIIISFRVPQSSEVLPLEILTKAIKDENSGLIYNLKERLSLVYNIDVSLIDNNLIIYAICNPYNFEKLKSGILWEIAKLKQTGIKDAVLSDVKKYLIIENYIYNQKNILFAYYLATSELLDGNYRIPLNYPMNIESTTEEKIKDLLKANFSNYYFISIVPKKKKSTLFDF